jgi:hypothetical protein
MPPADSLPPSATALVPLACGLPRCGRWFCAVAADDTCAHPGSCGGDGAPALRHTGGYRGEARASQVPGPSAASVPWSHTPPDRVHSSPTPRRSPCCLQGTQDPGPPGRVEVSGPHAPWPTRSPADASPRPFLTPAPGWLPARAGSPLAGQDAHRLDDTQRFMQALHPPVPIDPHCLVALIFLSALQLSHGVGTAGGGGGHRLQKWPFHFSKKWFFQRATSLGTLCLCSGDEVPRGRVSSAGARGSNTL